MQVLAYDPFVPDPAAPARAAALDELLSASDVVSLHCPLTPDTVGLLGGRELALMQPHAVLVNTARAPVVDEVALVEALASGRIGGAALDVFWTEPLAPDHPLLGLASVTLTPHLAGAADDVVAHHTGMIVDDVARWLAGERPVHLANPEVWG
jgi:phosphoglycerate dehydrogenase-like enzyme